MMLTPAEKKGLESILNELQDSDLFSLHDTVTKRMFHKGNRQDAIESILSCTLKPSDLLKRQKITRKVLFQYMLKLTGSVSPECCKVDLIMKCLEKWNSAETSQMMEYIENEAEEVYNNDLSRMGLEFIQWFYPLYNELNDFGVKHFWQDAILKVQMSSSHVGNNLLTVCSDVNVTNFLSSLIINEKLFFHPNDSSLKCEQEIHGMVRIAVSGTVHQLSNVVGIFDNMFCLIRNPAFENNWKIKSLYIDIKTTAIEKNSSQLEHNFSTTQIPN